MRGRIVVMAAIVTLAATTVAPNPVAAQKWAGWSVYWENDTWVPAKVGSDDAFTNGLRLVLGRDVRENLPGADLWRRVVGAGGNVDITSALVIGQNFFTPRSITEYQVDPTDRPYAGFTYVGVRYDVTQRLEMDGGRPAPKQHQTQHSLEVDLGVLGQGAGGRRVQAAVHSVITTHRIPKGWSHQVSNSLGASALYIYRSRWSRGLVDFTVHGGGMLGTTQTYPLAGGTLRFGKGMSGFPTLLARNTAVEAQARHPLEFGVQAGSEARYMILNSFVEGAPWSRFDPGVTRERWLGDIRVGFFIRVQAARFNYNFVRRSAEVAAPGPSQGAKDNYGSVSVSYEPGINGFERESVADFIEETLPSWFRGFYLEAGAGAEVSPDEPGTVVTHVMHGALGRRLWKDLDIGYEISGVGREFGPAAPGDSDHRDRMLIASAASLRYRPLGGRYRAFDFHVRAGLGDAWFLGGRNETELTPDAVGPRATPCPTGFETSALEEPTDRAFCNRVEEGLAVIYGVGLTWRPLGSRELGLNLDILRADVGAGAYSPFTGVTLGFRWTPNEPG